MKKIFLLTTSALFIACAMLNAGNVSGNRDNPVVAGTTADIAPPDPCPCDGNYRNIEVYYFGPDNVSISVFRNGDLAPANLITSFANVLNGQLLFINGAGLPGGALAPYTFFRVTNGGSVETTSIYTRCPSEAYPGATEELKVLGKDFGPFTVFSVTDQGNSFRCSIENAEQDWRLGGNVVAGSFNTFGTRNNESVVFITSNQSRGIMTSAGNFGLGNIIPASRLDVSGKGFFRNNGDALGLVGTDRVFMELYPAGATRRGVLGFANAGGQELFLENSFADGDLLLNTPRNIQLNSGRVGVGIVTPDAITKMHVVGSRIRLSTPGNVGRFLDLRTDGAGIDVNSVDDDLFIRSASNNVYINSQPGDGNVGIGTTALATGYRLSVNGRIACEELLIDDSDFWPDYVFEPEYQLKSIDELKTSLQANKHLPGIPSAAEVAETGIEIGEMQKMTMEKIEELHLYIIQLHERLKTLEDENAKLKSNQK